jgi:hypothetical protein
MGDASFVTIQEEWINAPDKFIDPPLGGLDGLGSGNFLSFAIANQWLSSLVYVCHEEEPDDLPYSVFKNADIGSGWIELKRLHKGALEGFNGPSFLNKQRCDSAVTIPFSRFPLNSFRVERPFDFAFVARSPSYTPIELDSLEYLVTKKLCPVRK